MSWIKLLYPAPQIKVSWGPRFLRAIHSIALHLAYYFAQSLALLGLVILYFAIIVPMRIWSSMRSQDLLDEEIQSASKSYLKKSESTSIIDFERMY